MSFSTSFFFSFLFFFLALFFWLFIFCSFWLFLPWPWRHRGGPWIKHERRRGNLLDPIGSTPKGDVVVVVVVVEVGGVGVGVGVARKASRPFKPHLLRVVLFSFFPWSLFGNKIKQNKSQREQVPWNSIGLAELGSGFTEYYWVLPSCTWLD